MGGERSAASIQSEIEVIKHRLETAKRNLEIKKRNRDEAKANGNYKNSAKIYASGSKVGTIYDSHVWDYEKLVAQEKERLAKLQEDLKKAKKK